ncbi:MAG: hypothetical protein WCO30_02140, partial [bacterium]
IVEMIVILTAINFSLIGLIHRNLFLDIFKTPDAQFIAYIVIGVAAVGAFVASFNRHSSSI